jgi:hypothetical protein
VVTDAELTEVWAAIEAMGYPWGPFFCIAILTLQRREEVAAMRSLLVGCRRCNRLREWGQTCHAD